MDVLVHSAIGSILALLGALIPRASMAALFISAYNPFSCLACFIGLTILNTSREIITPSESGNVEENLVQGKRLVFKSFTSEENTIKCVQVLKLSLLAAGIFSGAFMAHIHADNLSALAPFIALAVMGITLVKSEKPAETFIALIGLTGITLALMLLRIPAIIPILYLMLASIPEPEEPIEVDGALEFAKARADYFSIAALAIPIGILPGINPSSYLNTIHSGQQENNLLSILLNTMAEGVTLGIFLTARPTGKTVLTSQLSGLHWTPEFFESIGCIGIAGLIAYFLYPYFSKVFMAARNWKFPAVSLGLNLFLALHYASNNPWAHLAPFSGLILGGVLVAVLGAVTVGVPRNVRSLLACIPIAFA